MSELALPVPVAILAKDATTNTANVTVNTAGGTVGGTGGNIRFDGALNEDATARTLTLNAGTGAVRLAGGVPTNALTTLTSTGAGNTLGSVQTKGAANLYGRDQPEWGLGHARYGGLGHRHLQ